MAIAARARPGPISAARSAPVEPSGSSRTEPSGAGRASPGDASPSSDLDPAREAVGLARVVRHGERHVIVAATANVPDGLRSDEAGVIAEVPAPGHDLAVGVAGPIGERDASARSNALPNRDRRAAEIHVARGPERSGAAERAERDHGEQYVPAADTESPPNARARRSSGNRRRSAPPDRRARRARAGAAQDSNPRDVARRHRP